MATKILVPTLGESVVEATVGQWLKQAGDPVKVGEPLVELETDKVNLEVGAAQSGILTHIERPKGADVRIGDVLGIIEDAATGTDGQRASTPAPVPQSPPPTPIAKRVADDLGVDVAQVPGSGPRGRVTKDDVLAVADKQKSAPVAPSAPMPTLPSSQTQTPESRRESRSRLSRRRRTIAQRLVEAQHTAAMLTTFNEIDMGAVMDIRARRKESFKEKHGIGLGFMSFFVKASIGALKAFPLLNAELQGDELILKHYYDIGMAVGAEEGLVVPVLRDADRLSFADIEKAIKAFAEKAKAGTLSLDDLRGGTFTITNGGVFGSLLSTPILNPPQVGILGLHKIEERPIARGGQVVIRPMMYVALSYDHRIVDGREAVQFLVRLKELLEDPEALLLEG